MCRDANGNLTITAVDSVYLGASSACPDINGVPCEPTCGYPAFDPDDKPDWIDGDPIEYDPNDPVEPSIKGNSSSSDYQFERDVHASHSHLDEQTLGDTPLRIIPNPVERQGTVEFTSKAQGSVEILLVDVLGNQVILWKGEAKTGVNQQQINLSGFASGTYSIVMTIDGQQYATSSVVVK